MKKVLAAGMILLLLTGCTQEENLDGPLELRKKLNGSGCTFRARVTADYGEDLYVFSMDCRTDTKGRLDFQVLEPESIAGINGIVEGQEGKLTFDDKAVAFPLVSEGQPVPVSGPWQLLRLLRSGYIDMMKMPRYGSMESF